MLLIALSCAWIAGIILGTCLQVSPFLIPLGLVPFVFLLFLPRQKPVVLRTSLCLLAFIGAAAYYPFTVPGESQVSLYNDSGTVRLKGVVAAEPEVRDRITHLEFEALEIEEESGWRQTSGRVLLFVSRYPEYRYGDVLLIEGKMETPSQFEVFDYQAYLARDGIHSTLLYPWIESTGENRGSGFLAGVYALRKDLSASLASALPEPQASLAQGIVLGIRSSIPEDLKNNLSVTGTAHLLAISGINLSIIAGLLVTLGLKIFGRRRYIYVWLAIFMVWFYALITGMQEPVIRAAIMATLFLLAEFLGRQKSAFPALAFSAAVMAGITPQVLWSISFQLSFLSMLGIMCLAPHLQTLAGKLFHIEGDKAEAGSGLFTLITGSFSVTLGAVIAVWPLIAFNFGIISLIGPFSTLLIAPDLPFIILSGSFTAVIGLVSPDAAGVIGWVAWLFLSYMLLLVNAFSLLPGIYIGSSINSGLFWAYYSVLIILIWSLPRYWKLKGSITAYVSRLLSSVDRAAAVYTRLPLKFIIFPLLLIAALVSFTASTLPDKNLHVSFLDVGEGDAVLIQSGNQNILVDGGPSGQAVCLGLSRKLPYWDRDLDLVVLTHPHLDHLSGLVEVLHRYRVKQVLAPALIVESPFYREWTRLIDARNIRYTLAQTGQEIKLRNGAVIHVLHSPETSSGDPEYLVDNNSLVMRLDHSRISFLLTADIGRETEAALVNRRANLACTVLKVAHHGSATSTSPDFLRAAAPQAAVISAGRDNSFGHPDKEILSRLHEYFGTEERIFRTDTSGTVELSSDGETLRFKTG